MLPLGAVAAGSMGSAMGAGAAGGAAAGGLFLKNAAKNLALSKAQQAATKKAPPQAAEFSSDLSVYSLPRTKLKGMIEKMDENKYQDFLANAPEDFRVRYPDLPYL